MATAQETVNAAATKAGIKAIGQTLESGINTIMIDELNTMLNRWRNNGVDYGLSTLVAATEIFVDDADLDAIQINLALRTIITLNRPIPPGLAGAGKEAFTELQAKYMDIREMPLDKTLTRHRLFISDGLTNNG
ncbi:MAG: hypothetical protein V3R25_09190 [Nitrosomonadaceae bacterium]